MNSLLFKTVLLAALLPVAGFCATIDQAYQEFLAGSYEKSYVTYTEVYNSTGDINALYGLINSLTYLGRYEEALNLCKERKDPIISAKELWILGIQNEKRQARKQVSLSETSLSDENRAMLYQSGGYGFSTAENYREAVRWYEKAINIKSYPATVEALNYNKKKQKEKVVWSGTVLGGPIIYSQSQINDRGSSFAYDRGSFFDIGSRWDIKKKHTIEAVYSRFDASFLENSIGVNFQSSLFYSYDNNAGWHWNTIYSVSDSISNWTSKSKNNKFIVVDTFETSSYVDTLGNEQVFVDTTYHLYEEVFLGSGPGYGQGNYDTIITKTPEAIYQNNLFLGYNQWFVGGRDLHLGAAANLFNSNMSGMKSGALFYLYNSHDIGAISLSGNWYGTFTEEIAVLQASPSFTARFKKFELDLIPTYLYKVKAPDDFLMPGVQLSFKGKLSYTGESISLSGTVALGKRAFAGESHGKHLVNVTLPHKFTGSLSFAFTPGKKMVSYFINTRYENYEQMSRLIAFGGITLSL